MKTEKRNTKFFIVIINPHYGCNEELSYQKAATKKDHQCGFVLDPDDHPDDLVLEAVVAVVV